MEVKKVEVGFLKENCYLIKKDNDGLIVDPGDEIEKILKMIGDTNILGVLITHAHFDHIGALNDLIDKYNVPVYYHNINEEIEYKNLVDVKEQNYIIGNFSFDVIFTKGHRNDLVTYYFKEDEIMFTGDFLFHLSVGRTDVEYSDYNDMIKSIEKIKKYPDDITIYPGHGIKTSLGIEKRENIFLMGKE